MGGKGCPIKAQSARHCCACGVLMLNISFSAANFNKNFKTFCNDKSDGISGNSGEFLRPSLKRGTLSIGKRNLRRKAAQMGDLQEFVVGKVFRVFSTFSS